MAPGRLTPDRPDAPDAARALMHGIFVGEIQALEGAGRTCWDFEVGTGNGEGIPEVPFELKLDMARQCWDEARHCEISIKLSGHMGTELGEFSENTFLYEAACNPDPVLRLTGVNRALEGLAIDVFNTMREFGDIAGDPVLEFCEDWMLADEVTHVKMGSDWLRKLTANDKERQERALEFQRVVDKLFSPRRLPRRGGGQPRAPGPPLPRAGRVQGRGDGHPRRDRPRSPRGDGSPGRGQPRCGGQLGALMPVEVRPDTFSMVFFDATEIRAIVEKLVTEIGLPDDLSVTVEVDETTPHGARPRGVDRSARSSRPSRAPSRTSRRDMRALDRQVASVRQIGGATGMIEMAVGEQNPFEDDAVVVGNLQDPLDVAARIDHDAPHRRLAPDDGTVLLKWCYRNDDVPHDLSVLV